MEAIAIERKPWQITPEKAKEMAAKSHIARRKHIQERQMLIASLPASASERTRYERILAQIDKVDELISKSLDADELKTLVAAKDTLYHMIFPRRGSLKPRMEKRNVAPTIDADSGHIQPEISGGNGISQP